MTRLVIIFSLLFATPAWANQYENYQNNYCVQAINNGSERTQYKKLLDQIKEDDCDIILVQSFGRDGGYNSYLNYISRFCRFDRQIVVDENQFNEVAFSCVPKK